MTAAEIWEEGERQFAMLTTLDARIQQAGQRCAEATGETEQARLWDQYAGLCRDYVVLTAWCHATLSAYVFAVSGAELHHVTVDGVPPVEVAGDGGEF
jgi:hypothetical protein